MKFPSVFIGLGATLMLASLAVHAEPAPAPAAKPNPCAVFKLDDLAALLGGTPTAQARGNACRWIVSGGKYKLFAIQYANTGMAAEMAYDSARKNAAKAGPVTNEPGIGDRAYARMESFGVSMLIIKQGRLLQLQYGSGVAGTSKELDALLPVVKKAIAAF